jgi:EAL domain-containing protein (putative c-di-GMP-specific phosphodiesterase class I)
MPSDLGYVPSRTDTLHRTVLNGWTHNNATRNSDMQEHATKSDFPATFRQGSKQTTDTARMLGVALRLDEFVLYGQSIMSLQTQKTDRLYIEVLVRYLEEERKLIAPGTFIPTLEDAGLMFLLDRWVLKSVLKWMGRQRETLSNHALPRVSINLSADSIRDPGFLAYASEQISTSNIPPEKISFELSLSHFQMHHETTGIIKGLHAIKCKAAISGFTGGVATLPIIRQAGADTIKLHGTYMHRLSSRNPVTFEELKAIAASCAALGMETVSEMVEDQDSLISLRDAGIDYAQGYGLAHPVPLESFCTGS